MTHGTGIFGRSSLGVLFGFVLLLLACAVGCGEDDPDGVLLSDQGSGPRVVFDPLAKPIPEVPFPNDLVTVTDANSLTGRRLNVRMYAPTQLESGIRDRIDRLDGFGNYAPITVRFSSRLDIGNLQQRHRPDYDFSDDAVYLINLNRSSPSYGQPVPLDMGTGNFPKGLPAARNWRFGEPEAPDQDDEEADKRNYLYFKNDYRQRSSSLVFETEEEDVNCNGILDPDEDTDYDGVLDHPNLPDPENYNPACWPGGEPPKELTTQARYNDIVTFYEFETDTLIMRPIVPLEQASEYGVVLTNRVVGLDGEPVRSPFPYVHHGSQTGQVRRRLQILDGRRGEWGVSPDDVAFAWSFTTQTITRDLEMIRDGMMGRGSMAWLRDEYPPAMDSLVRTGVPELGDGNPYIVRVQNFELPLFVLAILNLGDFGMVMSLIESYRYVDYLVSGCFTTPYFLRNEEGVFHLDRTTGQAQVSGDRVTFWVAMPKRRGDYPGPIPPGYPEDDEPFGAAFYGHGYSMSSTEALGFAGLMAKFGIATIGMDAPGHGPLDSLADIRRTLTGMARDAFGTETLDEGVRNLLTGILGELLGGLLFESVKSLAAEILLIPLHPGIDSPEDLPEFGIETLDDMAVAAVETPFLKGGFLEGRAVDHTGDEVPDSGADFWTARTFHTRDIVRQGVVDHLQMVRLMEGFDGRGLWDVDINDNGARDDVAGDFDGDRVPDIGGRRGMGGNWGRYYTWGQSLGGFFSSIHAALDPAILAAAPVSAGAGLTDIGLRSTQDGVFQAVFLEVFGPMIIGGYGRDIFFDDYHPRPEDFVEAHGLTVGDLDRFWLAFDKLKGNKEEVVPIAAVPSLEEGDNVEALNLVNGEEASAGVRTLRGDRIGFRVAVESDFNDPIRITLRDAQGIIKHELTASCRTGRGYAHTRGSPDLRRFLGLAQMIVAPGDPSSYAPHLIFDPLPGMEPSNVLFMHSVGDPVVPVATGVAKARCAGLLGWQGPDPAYPYDVSLNQYLIDHYVTEGLKHLGRYGTWEDPWFFDPDNLSNGEDGLNAGRPAQGEELRVRYVQTEGDEVVGMSGLRLPFTDYENSDLHGVDPPLPSLDFDVGAFTTNQVGAFFWFDGRCITDDPCLEGTDMSGCEWFRAGEMPEDCRQ
jgi:hypothetical protein